MLRKAKPFLSKTNSPVMHATSQKQQKAAGAALSAKRGEIPRETLKGASRQMVKTMSEDQLEEMASAKRSDLPVRSDKD